MSMRKCLDSEAITGQTIALTLAIGPPPTSVLPRAWLRCPAVADNCGKWTPVKEGNTGVVLGDRFDASLDGIAQKPGWRQLLCLPLRLNRARSAIT
jgi:hypothetical protein